MLLTKRERQIFEMLIQSASTKEIANTLILVKKQYAIIFQT